MQQWFLWLIGYSCAVNLSLFHERNRLYKWFMGTFTSLIHEKVCYWSRCLAHKNEFYLSLKKKTNPLPLHMWSLTVGTTLSEARADRAAWHHFVCSLSSPRCPSLPNPCFFKWFKRARFFLKRLVGSQSLLTFDELGGKSKRTQIHVREEVSLVQNQYPFYLTPQVTPKMVALTNCPGTKKMST